MKNDPAVDPNQQQQPTGDDENHGPNNRRRLCPDLEYRIGFDYGCLVQSQVIAKKDKIIARQDKVIAKQDETIAEKDEIIDLLNLMRLDMELMIMEYRVKITGYQDIIIICQDQIKALKLSTTRSSNPSDTGNEGDEWVVDIGCHMASTSIEVSTRSFYQIWAASKAWVAFDMSQLKFKED